MGRRRSLWTSSVLGAAALAVSHTANADELSDARRHFRAGMTLIQRRQFDAGIAELETAYRFVPRPNVLYNIARAYYDNNNVDRALEYLRRYLQNDVPDRTDVESLVTRLEARQRAAASTTTTTTATARPVTTTAGTTTTTVATTGTTATTATQGTVITGTPLPADRAAALRALAEQLIALASNGESGTAATGSQATSTGVGTSTATTTTATTGQGATSGTASTTTTTAGGAQSSAATASGDNIGGARGDDEYEQRVVTASRVAQSPLDSPNATAVITAQDIRLSGLQSIPELLRRVAGVDVMQLDTGDYQVSIRGFNQRLSNKVLVLVDGRSVYLDFLGVTLWPTVFPAMEEIERIEIIRGPGSALYGADAYTGVINIITRPPGEGHTQVSVGAGNGSTLRGTFINSGRAGDLSYRASVQYEQRGSYGRPVGDRDLAYDATNPAGDLGLRTPRFMLDVQGRLGRGVILRGGVGGATGPTQFTAPNLLRQYWANVTLIQPYIQLEAFGFTARAFWNRASFQAGPVIAPYGSPSTPARGEQDVIDIDLQYQWRAQINSAVQNTLQIGAGYRRKNISWNYLDADHGLNFFSAFVQDTLRIGDRLSIVGSVRGDHHPVLDTPIVFSPRGSVIFRPTDRRAIRLTGGTAFRTPTMLELYLDLNLASPIPGLSVLGYGGEVYRDRVNANGRLRPETALSFDVGFQDQTSEVFQYEINAFFTRGSDLIDLANVAVDPLPGGASTSRTVPIGARFYRNDPAPTYVYGGELAVRVAPVEGLDFSANYTLACTTHDAASNLAASVAHAADQRTPMHKLNVGVQVRTRFGLEIEAFAHYVSQQTWNEAVFDPAQGSRDATLGLNDYVVVNGRIGMRLLNDRLDIGVTGTNLSDFSAQTGHREHPLGYRLWTRVMANVGYRF